jgi:uracil-DNA glycosylase family 4
MSVEPGLDCPLCPRLVAFRQDSRRQFPEWHNAPVRSFGDPDARLLIVGLAPGLRGANRTGRPFTGDHAGLLLYGTLLAHGFARGAYQERPDDGLQLIDCMITNAVRCVPPANKPEPSEINICRQFLTGTVASLPRLEAIVALGKIAHDSVLRALGRKLSAHPFAHGARHPIPAARYSVFDSYHCSRYNTNTGVLTPEMFSAVFAAVRNCLDDSASGQELLHPTSRQATI